MKLILILLLVSNVAYAHKSNSVIDTLHFTPSRAIDCKKQPQDIACKKYKKDTK